MIDILSNIVTIIGWITILAIVTTTIYFGIDFGFTLKDSNIKVRKMCIFGLGPVWFKLNKDNEELFLNIKACGWNMINIGNYAIGFSLPKPIGLMIHNAKNKSH